jgi:hypothetical protein
MRTLVDRLREHAAYCRKYHLAITAGLLDEAGARISELERESAALRDEAGFMAILRRAVLEKADAGEGR